MIRRLALVSGVVSVLGLAASAPPASAAEQLGSVGSFGGSCADNTAFVGPSVASGPDYIANAAGVVTTYSMTASSSLVTTRLLVLQPGAGTNYTLLQEDAARAQTMPGVVNTQTGIHLPIAAGQTIGLFVPDQPANNGWCLTGTSSSQDSFRQFAGEPPLNSSSMWTASQTTVRMNLAATVEPDCDNDGLGDETQDGDLSPCNNAFTVAGVTRNKKKGTATVKVNVPGPGQLIGSGNGAKVSAAGATTSKAVTAGTAKLLIKAKGKKKRKLNETGKVKLSVAVTYTPTAGKPNTQSIKVKLKKKL
jgi:hypothetical protein